MAIIKPYTKREKDSLWQKVHKAFHICLWHKEIDALAKELYIAEKRYDKEHILFTDFDWQAIVKEFILKLDVSIE